MFRVTLALLLALVLPGCALVQRGPRAPGPEVLRADSQVITGRLPNGLRYYIRANHEPPARAELRLVVNAGSVLEDEDQRGAAHFVEHMAFNGTTHFPKQALVDFLEHAGMRFGADVNAYTSFDETVFMLTLPTDTAGVLATGFQILEDWAHGVTFDSTEVEKERGVVLEEWRLGRGAGSRMRDEQFPVLAADSRYADRQPIGTRESILALRPSQLKRFYHDWYRPDLMAVVAVGDFDPQQVLKLIEAHFGPLRPPAAHRPRPKYLIPMNEQTTVSVVTDPEATRTMVSLYVKSEPRPWYTASDYRQWLVESLASGMLLDRLNERMDRPASPFLDVSSFQGRFLRPLSAYVLNVRVPEHGVERGLEQLLLEAERARRYGFTATELARGKAELLRREEQQYAERDRVTSSSFAADYTSVFLYGGTPMGAGTEYALTRRLLPEITPAEVNAAVREWTRPANRVVLVSGPASDSVRLPTVRALQRIIQSAPYARVEAYTDSLSTAPLVRLPPTPGRVVAEQRFDSVGVTEWTLANGVRVLLKPTDYREDEVLIAGRSWGGSSLLPDSDYIAAATASAVVQAGGLGALSSVELRKRLSGKVVGVGAEISDDAETISGAASPLDLETLFQLVYLKFTEPRLDSAAIEAYRIQARDAVANRAASPEAVFSDSIRAILTQHNPRARPLTGAMFDSLDISRSFQIYRDRFADASGFTFYLAGAFTPDSIRPLVEQWLGGLPSLHREEKPRDLGIRPPTGVVRRVVRRGLAPKSITQLVFTGGMHFDVQNVYDIEALTDVLRIRLRESLREEQGGTYGVSVRGGGRPRPQPAYTVAIGFGSDPARAPALVRSVFAEIDSLRTFGPTADELAKVREEQLRERQTDQRSNEFWVTHLMNYDGNGWPFARILDYPKWVAGLDAARVRSAARLYLDPTNFVQVTLDPDSTARGSRPGTELPSPGAVR